MAQGFRPSHQAQDHREHDEAEPLCADPPEDRDHDALLRRLGPSGGSESWWIVEQGADLRAGGARAAEADDEPAPHEEGGHPGALFTVSGGQIVQAPPRRRVRPNVMDLDPQGRPLAPQLLEEARRGGAVRTLLEAEHFDIRQRYAPPRRRGSLAVARGSQRRRARGR